MRLHQTIKIRTRRTRPPLTEYQEIEVLEDHRAPEFTIKKEQGKKKDAASYDKKDTKPFQDL